VLCSNGLERIWRGGHAECKYCEWTDNDGDDDDDDDNNNIA
jgi:hypothetical protein